MGTGVGWQRRRSLGAYFAFIEGSVRRPTETALAFDRMRSVTGLAFMHALACGASLAIVWAPLMLALDRGVGSVASTVGVVLLGGAAFAFASFAVNWVAILLADAVTHRSIDGAARRAAAVIGASWTALAGLLTAATLPLGIACGIAGWTVENLNPISLLVSAIDMLMGSGARSSDELAIDGLLLSLFVGPLIALCLGVRTALKAREALLPVAPRENGAA